ncbi:helix-turn-helix domain-containing protein [Asticcacaulis biprosthecium]|uniref:helix-turn-helix domain-containing protein n=1 Tax=Asticcacaulis biprosthecium TaxID=76891 RepID=UPI0009FD92D7
MPKLQQLRYLVAVADTLNFSRAARACHVTQPTLSMQLKEMEGRLKVQLVERTRSRVLLTPSGRRLPGGRGRCWPRWKISATSPGATIRPD